MRTIGMVAWGMGLVLMLLSAWVAGHGPSAEHAGVVADSIRWLGEKMGGLGGWEEAKTRDLALVVAMTSTALMVVSACVQIAMVDITRRKWS